MIFLPKVRLLGYLKPEMHVSGGIGDNLKSNFFYFLMKTEIATPHQTVSARLF